MDKLRRFLNGLEPAEQVEFAHRCGTTMGYLRKALSTAPVFKPELMVLIERHSGGAVSRWDLRPDDWHQVWPELVGADGAPSVPQREAA